MSDSPLPFATRKAVRLLPFPAVLGTGTFLDSIAKMKFTAGTPVEASEQIHSHPVTRRDAPRGAGQRFGSWWTPPSCATSAGSGGPCAGGGA